MKINTWKIGLYLMGVVYIFAGINHFLLPEFYLTIMPPYIPEPEFVNLLVGVIEIVLGILLFIPKTRKIAAWLIIALLIAVFPANIYHFQTALETGNNVIPTIIRLPFQAGFIYWAWIYTKY